MRKVAFVDFWGSFHHDNFLITDLIREICDIEIVDVKDAEYVFYSVFGDKHWAAPDDSIKIFYTGENLAPDFNACDYAIGFEWMTYEDRYMRFPLYYRYPDVNELMENRHLQDLDAVKKSKSGFCSVTVSNFNRDPMFVKLFDKLSEYKKVDSGGEWRNNIGGKVKDKLEFDKSHKFSIVCENSAHSGYTTEKLVQALAANCIPIYWGDPNVSKVFNPKAFINVSDYATLEELVEYVKKVDADDDLFVSYLKEPVLLDQQYCKEVQIELLRKFIHNIFTTPLDKAQRRNRILSGKMYIDDRKKQTGSLSYRVNKKYHKFVWDVKTNLRRLYWGYKGRG